ASPLDAVRARGERGRPEPFDGIAEAAALGWFGLLADDDVGGGSASEHPGVDAALIAYELGATLHALPYACANAVAAGLGASAVPSHRALLADVVGGRVRVTW